MQSFLRVHTSGRAIWTEKGVSEQQQLRGAAASKQIVSNFSEKFGRSSPSINCWVATTGVFSLQINENCRIIDLLPQKSLYPPAFVQGGEKKMAG